MKTALWKILSQFPPSHTNNARSIIRSKLMGFKDNPSTYRTQELDNLISDISVDFDDGDWGNGEKGSK